MSKKSDFAVMQEMTENPNNVIAAFTTFVEAKSTKQGGTIAMGVPGSIYNDFCFNPQKFIPVLYLVNREEFFKIKNAEGGVES